LIDEIFRGTNNRERQIGSRGYVSMLVGGHGTGLISTHDLELVSIADQVPNVTNYHFQEQVARGRMLFDYRLRPGPSKTTNAVQIMQMEGLPIAEQSLKDEDC
jgi:DNA mismatch repair ATPase MutS